MSGPALAGWLAGRPDAWRQQVGIAAVDPFRGYATVLRAQLPDATRVLDVFHVTRLAFTAVGEVRRRVQQETYGHRGHTGDPLYGIRRLLRRAAEHLSEPGGHGCSPGSMPATPMISRSAGRGSPLKTCGGSTGRPTGNGRDVRWSAGTGTAPPPGFPS